MLYLQSYGISDLLQLVDYYLKEIEKNGGCFHLWGHSWELEEYNLWGVLEDIFKLLSGLSGFSYLENRDLIKTIK